MKKFFRQRKGLFLLNLLVFLGIYNFAYSLTEEEFYQFLKKKRELVSSGKITMRVYNIKWKNEREYKKFAKELRTFIKASPQEFKEWFFKKEKNIT